MSRTGDFLVIQKVGIFTLFCLLLGQCQSAPYEHVQVGEVFPPGHCQEVGQVIGNATTRDGAYEQSMQDLRFNAAQREADYVRIVAVSAYGTAARGIAYRCR